MDKEGEAAKWFSFDLNAYREDMEYQDDASFLFITDPVSFFQDLKESIPISVEKNKKNLTSKRSIQGLIRKSRLFFVMLIITIILMTVLSLIIRITEKSCFGNYQNTNNSQN